MAKEIAPSPVAGLRTAANDVLNDLLRMLESEARRGVKEVLLLHEQAQVLIKPVLALEGDDKLRGIERIGHGLKSGLANIAKERLRNMWANVIQNSLGHASNIVKAGLGVLFQGV